MTHRVEQLAEGKVTLLCGDCLDLLATLDANSIDACVCDPPYGLSFMGKAWDKGVPGIPYWKAVYRVLKPGAHLLAFGGTRTFGRMHVAIEDAGFEIRDMVSWLYGSGFPKSLDVSKAIDKRKDWSALPKLQSAIHVARKNRGMSQSEAARAMGLIGPDEQLGGGGFMWFETGLRAPTREQWPRLKAALRIGDEFDLCFEEAEREITGEVAEWSDRTNYALTSKDGFRRDKPASDLAHEWQGFGTALKPACEPIVLARKPLSESTVAANVLKWGTGALNIDACRVSAGERVRDAGHDSRGDSKPYICPSPTDGQTSRNSRMLFPVSSASRRRLQNDLLSNAELSDRENSQSQDSPAGCHPSDGFCDGPIHEDGADDQASAAQLDDADKSRDLQSARARSPDCLSMPSDDDTTHHIQQQGKRPGGFGNVGAPKGDNRPNGYTPAEGRWPANVIHDGSDEVVGAFPESAGQQGLVKGTEPSECHNGVYSGPRSRQGIEYAPRNDSGSAARFFYTAKADADDRLGSKHPTVKPLDLMQYLCRLVCPPKGIVLDPFAGTGTTGEAAFREGMRAVLIEREAEYQNDIIRRMSLAMSSRGERAREGAKARFKGKPVDAGPLFGGIVEAVGGGA